MKNKTVFLTGAEGFIGSHMVENLVRKNFNVKALVLYNSFKDIHEELERKENIFILLGSSMHKIKKKAEQVACHEAIMILSKFI